MAALALKASRARSRRPGPAPEAAASPAVDTARVGELMQKIQANPKDVTSLQSLADIYYGAGDVAESRFMVSADQKRIDDGLFMR